MPDARRRTDELWRHSCFEAFVGLDGEPGYCRTQFLAVGRWAAYAFDDYRTGMRDTADVGSRMVDWRAQTEAPAIRGRPDWSTCRATGATSMACTAVIEATDGTKSYWALEAPARAARFPQPGLLYRDAPGTQRAMKFGIDRLLADPDLRKPLEGKRVALLAHPASVTADLTHSLDALVAAGLNVSAMFGPQHGVRGDLQDNMMESPDFTDPTYNIPVFSLYGEVRRPTRAVDGDVRHDPDRPAGCRVPHLHLRHDLALRARSRGASMARRCGCSTGPTRRGARSRG